MALPSKLMESLRIISWNIRGVVDHTDRVNLKIMIQEMHPLLICLQETKCSGWDKFMKASLWGEDDHGWIHTPSSGLSGGLLTLWDKSSIECCSYQCYRYLIRFDGKRIATGQLFTCFNIYAHSNLARKALVWDELSHLFWMVHNSPTLLIGGFNSVR